MFIGVRLGMPTAPGGGAGAGVATIQASNLTLAENSAEGTAVGNLSVSNGTGTYTFTLTDDAGSRFKVAGANGVNLQAGSVATNYEGSNSHDITVHADNGAGSVLDRTFSISIINSLEVTLNALTLDNSDINDSAAEDTLVGALQSTSVGSALSMTDTAGGLFKLSGSNVVAGAIPTDFDVATSHNITVRETNPDASNSPRDSIITITINAPVVPGSGDLDFNIAGNGLLVVLEDF